MATSSSNPCPSLPTFLHSSLVIGATCPICQQVYSPSEQAPAPGLSVTQSQYAPITTGGAVAPYRQTIGKVAEFRALKPITPSIPRGASPLKDILFAVRIAYASYLPQKDPSIPPLIQWTVFQEDWIAAIPSTLPLS